ncbi:MAG: DUF1887 family protein [Prevotellaceae bacterium]|jgi:hypothetical protein|nr:DUF1887 family protein [Prevotellaceae bacterium]
MKNLIVTLLSDQTIQNVQFIKHIQEKLKKGNREFEHLFISTESMEKKGVGKWISKVCAINRSQTIVVEHNSLSDIQEKLKNTVDYETYFVNVTGGTKIMSLGISDFFKEKVNARIYYIDGNKCWLNFPINERYSNNLADNINLTEYIESYGFEMRESSLSGIGFEYTKLFLQEFLKFGDAEWRIIKQLREKRNKKNITISEIIGLQDFLCNIGFPLSDKQFLIVSKNEIEYLTGDWFEEYIYFRLKEEKIISGENLKTGVHLVKNGIDNEFDVIFLHHTKFYAVECKTSILSEKGNIINETIYKSTALQKNLGLFSNFSIFTLSSQDSKDVKQIHMNRAEDLNIQFFCREDIINCENISKLLRLC